MATQEIKQNKISTTKDLTVGSYKVNILSFALPILISQLFQQLYNTVDSLIVGNFLGKQALAAVSSSAPLILLLVSFFEGSAMGAGVVIARYFGAGDRDKVSKTIHTNVIFGFICGILLTLTGVFLTPYILQWMRTASDVLPQSTTYFRYYFAGVIFQVMYNIFTGVMRAVGDSKRPLIYLIVSSLLNILLDTLFVGVFKMGVGAVAIATVISQAVSAGLCLIQLLKKGTIYQLSLKKLKIDTELLKEIIKYGLPTGIQNSVIGIANVIVQSSINTFGTDAMAGFGSYAKIEGFAFLPITSFSLSLSTFIGQNLGAGKLDRAKKGGNFGIAVSTISAEVIGLIIFIGAPVFINAFSKDPVVTTFGVTQARQECFFYFLLAFSHAVASVCRGAGKAIVPMGVMLTCWCVIRIIFITIIMQFVHKIEFIYWAYPITWSLSSIIYLIYYLKSDWIHSFTKKEKINLEPIEESVEVLD